MPNRQYHRKSKTRLYHIWLGMKSRCNNPNDTGFQWYGGRGIGVCATWAHDFLAFEQWALANSYAEDLALDRINVEGNYAPENCRWVTVRQNNRNTRRARMLTAFGETKALADWLDDTRCAVENYMTLYDRVFVQRLDDETAITRPKGRHAA